MFLDDKCIIRQVLKEFYITQKVVMSTRKLLSATREQIHFVCGQDSLINIMKGIGYRWQKCQRNSKVLIVKPGIMWRYKFLEKIKALRITCNNIFYLDKMDRQ